MNLSNQPSDEAILEELGERLARHRLDLNRTQAQLADAAGVAKRTIERLEAGKATQFANLIRVLRALGLGSRLDLLIPPAIAKPIEGIDLRGKRRRRAS